MAPRIELQQRNLIFDAGAPLHYAVGRPAGAAGSPRPVVLGLHFGWQEPLSPRMGRDFLRLLVEPGLGDLGAVLLGPTCPERTWHQRRSETALLALLDQAFGEWGGDPRRVILIGFSLGGMAAWYLGAHYPERFCHVVPVATLPVLGRGEDDGVGIAEFQRVAAGGTVARHAGVRRVPWTVIHSRADELVPWVPVERAVAEMQGAGADIELRLLEGIGHYESARYVEALRQALPRIRRSVEAEAVGVDPVADAG